MANIRKAAVAAAMNRWRSLVSNRQPIQTPQRPSVIQTIPEEPTLEAAHAHSIMVPGKPMVEYRHIPAPHPMSPVVNGQTVTKGSVNGESEHSPQPSSSTRPSSARPSPDMHLVSHTDHNHDHVPRLRQEDEASPPLMKQQNVHQNKLIDEATLRVPRVEYHPVLTTAGHHEIHALKEHSPRPITPLGQTKRSQADTSASSTDREHQRMLRRASRAREIYLASKVFNHWADRTARRLEREAIARRHMIRFRYFRSWSQAPALREPTLDQMRAVVVVKKWKRIMSQENELKGAALEAARGWHLKKIQHALDHWLCHRLEDMGRCITTSRNRAKAIVSWQLHASSGIALDEAIKSQTSLRRQLDTLNRWQNVAENETAREDYALRIRNIHQSKTRLGEWREQTELRRLALTYRQHTLKREVSFAFEQWNLKARAQAFAWKREYTIVDRVFECWWRRSEQDLDLRRRAEGYYEGHAKRNVLGRFYNCERKTSQLQHLENRARLFLGATRLLDVFDQTAKHRQQQDKEHVKRYLMARYKEVSAARKKRNFLAALDRWRATMERAQAQTDISNQFQQVKQAHEQKLALATWSEHVERKQQHLDVANLYYAKGWFSAWQDHARDLEQRDIDAWRLWAVDKQRNCLKEWSIASLQQGGQAHTASQVRKKHEREKRSRVLQVWRQRDELLRNAGPGSNPRPASAPRPQQNYRGSWRALSGRRPGNRLDRSYDLSNTPMETPTRWTGQPFSMSAIMPGGSMAPLREADEDDAASSVAEDMDHNLDIVASPSRRYPARKIDRFSTTSSTTPRAPLPSHLFDDVWDPLREQHHSEPDTGLGPRSLISEANSEQPKPIVTKQIPLVDSLGFRLPVRSRDAESTNVFLDTRRAGGRTVGPQSALSETSSQSMANKSLGANPSKLRFGGGQTSGTRSVRIQSPRTYSIRTPGPVDASRKGMSTSSIPRPSSTSTK